MILLISCDDYKNPPYWEVEEFNNKGLLKERVIELEAEMKKRFSRVRGYKIVKEVFDFFPEGL